MSDPAEPAITALAGSTTETVGRFQYHLGDHTWWWSPSIYATCGFEPGEVVPTAALMAAHQHPDDRAETVDLIVAAVHAGKPFCSRHRIVDARHRIRTVVGVGVGRPDQSGRTTDIHGYMIDLAESLRRDLDEATGRAVDQSAASRATIEQAKGALMITYGLDDEEAFTLLRWHSQHANIKLRDIADTITGRAGDPDLANLPAATRIHHILTHLTHAEALTPATDLTAPRPPASKQQKSA